MFVLSFSPLNSNRCSTFRNSVALVQVVKTATGSQNTALGSHNAGTKQAKAGRPTPGFLLFLYEPHSIPRNSAVARRRSCAMVSVGANRSPTAATRGQIVRIVNRGGPASISAHVIGALMGAPRMGRTP
jgi:hypothetical protein